MDAQRRGFYDPTGRVALADLTNADYVAIAFFALFAGSVLWGIVRLIVRLRNDDVEVSHRWSDVVSRKKSRRRQRPEDFDR